MIELVFPLLATLATCALTGAYMATSRKLEPPSERGMHTIPVPSGAGITIIGTTLLLWPLSQSFALSGVHMLLLASLAGLALVSGIDDRYQLPPAARLGAHAVAVALLLSSLGPDQRLAPALPLALERAVLGLAWLWFINFFNFMDGIDGIAGSEAIAVATGYVAVAAAGYADGPLSDLALIVGAACAGYLVWNWPPAKVFMGDTGSITLGLLLGWLMIDLTLRGHWAAALILPAYFAADATLTLASRLRLGQKPWKPHREHFYQRAVLGGATPSAVVRCVSATNALLIVLAVVSIRFPYPALLAAGAAVAGLLTYLQHLARQRVVQASATPPSSR